MNIDKLICDSRKFMSSLDEKMNGLKLPGEHNSRTSGALLHLSLEHFGAIVELISKSLNGSAAALLRLQYESLIRGWYFYHCASEKDALKFSNGEEPPRIKQMIECLEKKPEFNSDVLSTVHDREWKTLNSFTHGGSAQTNRRFNGIELVSNYSDEDLISILTASRYMALVAATHVAISCGKIDLAKEFKSEHDSSTNMS